MLKIGETCADCAQACTVHSVYSVCSLAVLYAVLPTGTPSPIDGKLDLRENTLNIKFTAAPIRTGEWSVVMRTRALWYDWRAWISTRIWFSTSRVTFAGHVWKICRFDFYFSLALFSMVLTLSLALLRSLSPPSLCFFLYLSTTPSLPLSRSLALSHSSQGLAVAHVNMHNLSIPLSSLAIPYGKPVSRHAQWNFTQICSVLAFGLVWLEC